jgi:hypothetical protein
MKEINEAFEEGGDQFFTLFCSVLWNTVAKWLNMLTAI